MSFIDFLKEIEPQNHLDEFFRELAKIQRCSQKKFLELKRVVV